MRLLKEDRDVLLSGKWLNDRHITTSQRLLHQQHPYVAGLQDTMLQMTRTFDVHKNRPFVQCLNLGGYHWKTVSTAGCVPGSVKVYDSMHL